jgi:uncharacterized membrane protein
MDNYAALKWLHVGATLVLFLSAIAVVLWIWRARRGGEVAVHARALRWPWMLVWLLMGVCLVAMPVSGWWLVHLAGWPLEQTWLLGSAVLFLFGSLSWLWLVLRLATISAGPKLTTALAVFCALCFIGAAGLMGAKPV